MASKAKRLKKYYEDSATFSNVFRSFTVTSVLFTGVFLLAATIWTWSRRIFVYTYFMEITLDTTYFLIPAGLLTFPCALLTYLLKTNRFCHLLTLLAVHVLAIAVLLTGHFLGTVYKLDYSNTTEHMSVTIPKTSLNHTLYALIRNFEKWPKNYTVLNRIHKKFECCGVVGKEDFAVMPPSCCPKEQCEKENVYLSGCLRAIQANVAWHMNISSSLIQLLILLHIFNVAMALNLYVSDRSQFKQIREATKRQER